MRCAPVFVLDGDWVGVCPCFVGHTRDARVFVHRMRNAGNFKPFCEFHVGRERDSHAFHGEAPVVIVTILAGIDGPILERLEVMCRCY